MLKYIMTKDITYKGRLFRGRKIVADDTMLAKIIKVPEAIFTWGWRSKAEQAEMVAKGVSKTMDSNHRRGVAFDIWNWSEVEAKMKTLGFLNDLKPWDPGHFTPGGEAAARKKYSIIDTLPEKLDEYKGERITEKVVDPVTVPTPEPEEVKIPVTVVVQPPAESQTIELGKIEIPRSWVDRLLELIKKLLNL